MGRRRTDSAALIQNGARALQVRQDGAEEVGVVDKVVG